MNILVVSQYYYPEQFRVNDICEELARRGNTVTVLTGLPNYPKGEVYEGYRNGKNRKQTINGVNVVRCSMQPRKTGVVNLAINYVTYAVNASRMAKKLQNVFDVVFVYQMSPVTMAFPAITVKKKFGIPIVLYCCDLWPASILDVNIKRDSILYKMVKRISSYIYNSCDEIIVTSPSFQDYLQIECAVKNVKMDFVPQHAEDTYTEDSCSAVDNGIVDFMFLGNIGLSQNCDCIIKAASLLDKELPFKIHFVGAGSKLEDLKKMVDDYGLNEKVVFHGFQKMETLPGFYAMADACLLTLAYDSEVGLTIPAKLQGYMAAGKPVVAAISGDAKKIINESECGYQVEAGDYEGLAKIMLKVVNNPLQLREMGENGRMYFNKYFAKKPVIDKLEDKIKDCLK